MRRGGRGKSLRHTPGDPSSFLALEIIWTISVLLCKGGGVFKLHDFGGLVGV